MFRDRTTGFGRRAPLDGEILPPLDDARDGADAAAADAGRRFRSDEASGEDFRADQAKVERRFWVTLRRAVRQVPFTEDLVAAYYCAIDPETPFRVRATLIAALAYFVVPLDGLPDFIVGLGFGDDVTVLATAIGLVAAHITGEHRHAARRALDGGLTPGEGPDPLR